MSRIHLVVGDTRPAVYVQLAQPGVPVDVPLDVSTGVVVMRFKPWDTDEVLFQLTGEKLPGTLQANMIEADLSQYPVAGSGGRVRFFFLDGSLDLPVGRYLGEIEVSYGVNNEFTAYSRLQFQLRKDF